MSLFSPMHTRLFSALLLVALFVTPATAQDTDPFMRHPAVHPDGDEIAFSYQGDLWTVPIDGGEALLFGNGQVPAPRRA
ncbi:MAG: hypothetical protein BRD30_13620, partial [Bacteroidetes bacterium QH_2_63_10]